MMEQDEARKLVGFNFVLHIEPYQVQIYNKFSNGLQKKLQKTTMFEIFATDCCTLLKGQ